MPELIPVTVRVTQDTIRRYTQAGRTRGLLAPDDGPEKIRDVVRGLMSAELIDAGQFLPPPAPEDGGRRRQAEVRDTSRERNGGVSAHTQAMRALRPDGQATA